MTPGIETLQHAEEILYAHTWQLWHGCSDPLRRELYREVLEHHRKRMRRLGFTDDDMRRIETFSDTRQEAIE